MNKQYLILAGTAVAALAAGAAAGYYVGRKKATHEFELRLEVELETARNHYALQNRKANFSPEDIVRELDLEETAVATSARNSQPAEPVTTTKLRTAYHEIAQSYVAEGAQAVAERASIWDKNNSTTPPRGPNGQFVKKDKPNEDPYIIEQAEYLENDSEYEQEHLTYYVQDNTLLDTSDKIVDNATVSEVALSLLRAQEEKDEEDNVIYVRNEVLGIEYEIVINHDSVSATLGLDLEG